MSSKAKNSNSPRGRKKKRIDRYFVSRIFFILGLILICISGAWKLHEASRLSFASTESIRIEKINNKKSIPTYIQIPSLGLGLTIEESAIQKGIWGISESGASHLNVSAVPGEKGNIVLYAHNTNDKFGILQNIEMEAMISLGTLDGKTYRYEVYEIQIVNPNQTEMVEQTDSEILTLYTCYGFADSQRFVVRAKPLTK
jgi:LPXTG-site transpeptidase (sortase) family protein